MPQGGISETVAMAGARDRHLLWNHVLLAITDSKPTTLGHNSSNALGARSAITIGYAAVRRPLQ